ncbi:hypothetical protein ACR9YC_11740 [Parasphingorhabdus sp. DH2-15]|uniref:hypothetical protein n=1 Tax=Parasphingorhabdus sp. DH2-15 TaxID=3444112 RepID=UPI003F6851DD
MKTLKPASFSCLLCRSRGEFLKDYPDMSPNPFKHFLSPQSLLAVDTAPSHRFDDLADRHPDLEVFIWDEQKSDTENFETLVQSAIAGERNRLLVGGCSVDQSCLVISLLALGRGFDVYVCGDLIDGSKDEVFLLIERLRQQGAMIVSKKQVLAEFSANPSNMA